MSNYGWEVWENARLAEETEDGGRVFKKDG